ncbi:CRISPR-associated endonuclease Cas2 [Bordetella avium]|uniref:CRISPR-associated endonuclease Cas2 n=1 Tax=Bordetella avium TaxID=521 RepID=UPI000E688563|nr:CRISPR-associated endonuclease Cas2 [Bordetella avium]RIQ18702.1 CRISPR-associated endonuclease Cas2 [Bordetella avium]RIQ35262.1 CRISPR-associated endonuclease Cas2 [Bordetella avium]
MMVLVSYDVSTQERAGLRRLRHIAKACQDFGQRVQYSVFEIEVDAAQWVQLKDRLTQIINPELDSLRFYYLGQQWQSRVEHVGAKPVLDLHAPLVF